MWAYKEFFSLASFLKKLNNKTLVADLFFILLYRQPYSKLLPLYILHFYLFKTSLYIYLLTYFK